MFGSSNPFGQSSGSPFGSPSVFGQSNSASSNPFAPKPFGSTTPFGSQIGSSMFGSTSTGVFGAAQSSSPLSSTPVFGASSSPGFGNTTPAFGASSVPAFGSSSSSFGASSGFGQKPVFAGFGSATQTNPFGSTFQQSQPAFGSNVFGSSAPFGASSQPSFGATSTPAFGSSSTPSFGSTITPGFGATSTPMFGSTTFGSTGSAFGGSNTSIFGTGAAFGASTTPVFGPSTSPAFGVSSAPSFSGTSSPSFAASSTPLFGSSSTPSFGTSTTPSFSFGSSPVFGQSSSAFGSSPFGSTAAPFGGQSSPFGSQASPTFGTSGFGQSTFGGQRGGSRIAPYTPTTDPEGGSSTQPTGKMESISAMPAYKDKSHEELRWEDYHLGDKGGPNPAGQPAAGGFGASTVQNPFASSSTFGQSSSNPFSTSTPTNLFATKPPAFGSQGFGTSSSTSAFGSSVFGSSTTSNPFGSMPSATPSIFGTSSPAFGSSPSSSLFASSSSSAFGVPHSPFGSTPAQGTTPSFGAGLNFSNTQSSPLFQSTTPSLGLTGSSFGQTGSSFGQNAATPFQSSIFSTPSAGLGGSFFSSTPQLSTSAPFGFGQTTPSLSSPFQANQATQMSNPFSFSNFGQTQSAGTTGFGGGPSIFGQSFGQLSTTHSPAVAQSVTITNPFGTLPAMPQISIGRARTSPPIQYGISSMPVVDKPAPVRISSLLTSRHLSQRRIKLPARKYHPRNNELKIPFFSDGDEGPSTPKADALFVPRENPRALIIRPVEQRPLKADVDKSPLVHENGKTSKEENGPASNGSIAMAKDKTSDEDGQIKDQNNSSKHGQKNDFRDDTPKQNGDSYITLTGHRAGEAAIVYEHGADIEAMMPKLWHSDYYTEPRIQELAAKERAEPGYCRRVKDFVVGRHGYGSIKFLGETDVRRLDLESLIQFDNREVCVYMNDSTKPPLGQGLNKPAEVTLLNIKCYDKKAGRLYTEGPEVEKYKEMLKKKAEDQGAEYLSYDPVIGEWKFRVSHF